MFGELFCSKEGSIFDGIHNQFELRSLARTTSSVDAKVAAGSTMPPPSRYEDVRPDATDAGPDNHGVTRALQEDLRPCATCGRSLNRLACKEPELLPYLAADHERGGADVFYNNKGFCVSGNTNLPTCAAI